MEVTTTQRAQAEELREQLNVVQEELQRAQVATTTERAEPHGGLSGATRSVTGTVVLRPFTKALVLRQSLYIIDMQDMKI